MKKRVVAGLLTALMALQTPFMALAAEPADMEMTVDVEAMMTVPEAVADVNVTTVEMTECTEETAAEGMMEETATEEVAAYGTDEVDALQAEDVFFYPADESLDKHFLCGDQIKMYFIMVNRGVKSDRWFAELRQGTENGKLVAKGNGNFASTEGYDLVTMTTSSSNLAAGTYTVVFWMEYDNNGTYVVYPKKFKFNIYLDSTRTPLSSLKIASGAQMPKGAEATLAVSYEPANTTDDTTVSWTNSNPNAVELLWVDGTQVMAVRAKDYGISYITAQMGDKTAVCIIAVSPDKDSKFPFSDISIKKGNWKYENVKYVYEKGIMNGISGTTWFEPDSPLTRAMFATVLYRMAGSPAVTYTNKFADVPAGKYYSEAIIWANQKGIVKGVGDGTSFGVDQNITREQIAKMLNEYAKACGYNVSQSKALDSYTDKAEVSGWATGYMQWATGVGLISGKPNADGSYRLDPKGEATRAECAKMLTMFDTTY